MSDLLIYFSLHEKSREKPVLLFMDICLDNNTTFLESVSHGVLEVLYKWRTDQSTGISVTRPGLLTCARIMKVGSISRVKSHLAALTWRNIQLGLQHVEHEIIMFNGKFDFLRLGLALTWLVLQIFKTCDGIVVFNSAGFSFHVLISQFMSTGEIGSH